MMLFHSFLSTGEDMKHFSDDYEDFRDSVELNERLRKTLYYGKMPSLDRPSLAITELAVEVLQDMAPRELGKIDVDWAAAMSRELLLSPCSIMVGMMYAKRLRKKRSTYLHQISSTDLFLVSVMMASKFLYDEGEDGVLNDEWAASVNMDVKELNDLERQFLAAMDWQLYVSSEEFWASLLTVERQLARRKAKEPRSLTYTELWLLSTDVVLYQRINELLFEFCKVVSVCAVAYAASALLLTASQLTVYATVSTFVAIGCQSTRHPMLGQGVPPVLPVPVDGRSEDSPLHNEYTGYITNNEDCPSAQYSNLDHSPETSVSNSFMNVLISTLSGLFTTVSTLTCNSSDRVNGYCSSSIANLQCHSSSISAITLENIPVNMPDVRSLYCTGALTGVYKNCHQAVMISENSLTNFSLYQVVF